MLNIYTVLVIVLLTAGCRSRLMGTAPTFLPYTAEWNQLTGRGAKTPITWGDIRSDWQVAIGAAGSTKVIAKCSAYRVGNKWHDKRIVVNSHRWFELGTGRCYKLMVVIHELVHCETERRGHDSSSVYELSDGTEVMNIMAEAIYGDSYCNIDDIRQQVIERWGR
jgi:hypothetical protein